MKYQLCFELNWFFYDPSWSKISSDQKRLFFAVSLYLLSFFANAPFNFYILVLIMKFLINGGKRTTWIFFFLLEQIIVWYTLNSPVLAPPNCDFRFKFYPIKHNFFSFFLKIILFLVLNEKYKIQLHNFTDWITDQKEILI